MIKHEMETEKKIYTPFGEGKRLCKKSLGQHIIRFASPIPIITGPAWRIWVSKLFIKYLMKLPSFLCERVFLPEAGDDAEFISGAGEFCQSGKPKTNCRF